MPAPNSPLPLIEMPDGLLRELGVLEATGANRKIALPLRAVDISATVAERIATVTLKQVFSNTLTDHMEAVYTFPLAAGCAVSSFTMLVGKRKVEGVVRERSEARREYQQAISTGNRAALMEQERDDVFTVQVGNLPPGETVTIEIAYSERLPYYEDGKTELRLPLVVAPRYVPGQELTRGQTGFGVTGDTNLVPDASRISPPRLVAGNNADVKLSVTVDILPDDTDSELQDLECSQHAVRVGLKPGTIRVSLASANELLNRDFVLRWKLCSDSVKTSMLTFTDEQGQTYAVLSVVPPKKVGYKGSARDVIFVVDKSGSMQGLKMVSAVRACLALLNTLGPRDRFSIVSFDNTFNWMPASNRGSRMLDADESGLALGEKFLRDIVATGGTELDSVLGSVISACSKRSDKAGRTASIVVITDGEVGNESPILKRIQRDLGDTRLFAVGVDTAVNAGLLKRMAGLGGGTASFVEPGTQLEEALTSIAREIGHPLVTDLQVNDHDRSVVDRASFTPSRMQDVFAGRASIGFFKLSAGNKVRVTGKLPNGKSFESVVSGRQTPLPAIAQLWAKSHIVDLEDQFRIASSPRSQLKATIVDLAVRHSLLTKFTAFVVVDRAEVVNEGGHNRTMVQPVEMPANWEEAETKPQRAKSSLMGQLTKSRGAAPADQANRAVAGGTGGGGRSAPKADREYDDRLSFSKRVSPEQSRDNLTSLGGVADGASPLNLAESIRQQAQSSPAIDGPAASGWGSANNAPGSGTAPQEPAPRRAALSGGMDKASLPLPTPGEADADANADQYGLNELSARLDDLISEKQNECRTGVDSESAASPPPPPAAAPAPTPASAAPPAPAPAPLLRAEESKQKEGSDARWRDSEGHSLSGSYGSGVREQVFEVIVRQAMAGAPWREISAGPMRVNNISEEQVDAEVARRRALLAPPPSVKPRGGLLGKLDQLKRALFPEKDSPTIVQSFLLRFAESFATLESGARPNASMLEKERTEVVSFLANTVSVVEAPNLQRFLRLDAIELIASLQDSNTTIDELKEFWESYRDRFETVLQEVATSFGCDFQQAERFWESSV